MGFWRFPQSGVVARLAIGALGSGILLLAGQAPASAHGVTPSVFGNFTYDTTPDVLLSCQMGAQPPCYGPAQLHTSYHLPDNLDGAGQTIVIIGAFKSPTILSDLNTFDGVWHMLGQSGPPVTLGLNQFQEIAMPGTPTANPGDRVQRGWAIEAAIDVEWSHAVAPGADLILVEARSGDDADILEATKYAIDNNLGDVISMSFSEAESCPTAAFLADEHAAFERAVAKGITLVAASGDTGVVNPNCDNTAMPFGVATPASDPLVTAVGGTHLVANPGTGAYVSETAWAGSGGGFSSIYRRPAYQAPFQKNNGARGVPDVAWSADVFGFGPSIALGMRGRAIGTSVATAEWAGVAALADQAAGHRLGALNVHLYHAGKSNGAETRFHDIVGGNNSSGGFAGYDAVEGWDPITGLGTPDVANLVARIAQTA